MPTVDLVVPQMGEGLREVLILELHKKPGDEVAQDEVIYTMETDKADVEVESPHAGVLSKWWVAEGDTVKVGAPIARLERGPSARDAPTPVAPRSEEAPPSVVLRKTFVSPRARAHGEQMGLSSEDLGKIPAVASTLTPADVDRHLAERRRPSPPEEAAVREPPPPAAGYEDHPLSAQQRVFNYRLERSASRVVAATMVRLLPWPSFAAAVQRQQQLHPAAGCSEFEVFAYAVTRATRHHPRFRSTLRDRRTLRRFRHLHLGVAVQRLDDDLATAVVREADRLDFPEFVAALQEAVVQTLTEGDQAEASVQLLVNDVRAWEIVDANPVLVAPATSLVFLGAPQGPAGAEAAKLGVTFDHRLINGVGAAEFLRSVVREVAILAEPEAAEAIAGDKVEPSLRPPAGTSKEIRSQLHKDLHREVAALIGDRDLELDAGEPLRNLGLNSRLALQLVRSLRERFGDDLSPTLVWAYPTIDALAEYLADRLAGAKAAGPGIERSAAEPRETGVILDELDGLSDEEAEALVAEKLKGLE